MAKLAIALGCGGRLRRLRSLWLAEGGIGHDDRLTVVGGLVGGDGVSVPAELAL